MHSIAENMVAEAAEVSAFPPVLPDLPVLALVHLHVPKSVKGAWVRQSRLEGKRLSVWIRERVERA